jgi:hypothetical protein
MSAEEKRAMSGRDTALQARFRLMGICLLVAGLLAAAVINWTAAPDDGSADAILSGASKRYEYDMERIGGKSNVVAAELRDWFVSLWHGRRLAHTLVFLSVGGSLACFLLAHLLSYPPPPDERTEGKDVGENG